MNTKKNLNPPINPGISLLVVVFLVLCLFTFSAITLATAINEHKRSKLLIENTKAYYEAANLAEEDLQKIINNVKNSESDTIAEVINYSYSINDYLELQVTLEPTATDYFVITKWQVVSSKEWETNETMNLLQL